VLYRIDPNDRDPYVNLYLPKALGWVERNGWLLADVRNHERAQTKGFSLAVYPLGPYRWMEIREATASNIMVRDGDLIDGWLLRIDDPMAGLVLEAVERSALEFEPFVVKRAAERPRIDRWQVDGIVTHTTIEGTELEMHYDGPHLVNGQAIEYDDWPLVEAPWVRGDLGSGVVRYEKDGERLDLDFEAELPLIPMRVIG